MDTESGKMPAAGRLKDVLWSSDAFSENELEQDVLTRKPVCFIVTGKPGAGKTELAKHLAAVWNCQLITSTACIQRALETETALGMKAKTLLESGKELDESIVSDIIVEELKNSKRTHHYGYVLDSLPSTCENWKSIDEQLSVLKKLEYAPDVVINLRIPDVDLLKRRTNQKTDPVTSDLYTKSMYNPSLETQSDSAEEEDDEGKDEDSFENVESKEDLQDEEHNADLIDISSTIPLEPDVLHRLVVRETDLLKNVEEELLQYRDVVMRKLEDYFMEHNQQLIIELDANLSPLQVFKSLLMRLSALGLPRAPVPKKLLSSDDEEEELEGVETEQYLSHLSEIGMLLPKFKWRKSCFGRFCPVELANGNMVKGRMQYAVGFLDKMYSLSSQETLEEFIINPRPYLLPPHPLLPFKVCIVGPPSSGKSTIAQLIANEYNALVLNIDELLKPVIHDARQKAIEEAKHDAENSSISTLTAKLASQSNDDEIPEVSVDHPDVQSAIKLAVEKVESAAPEITREMYLLALKNGIESANLKRTQCDVYGRSFGGWVFENFPQTRDHWAIMVESQFLPDCVISLEDDRGNRNETLLNRFIKQFDPELSADKLNKAEGENEDIKPEVNEKIKNWKKRTAEFDVNWKQLSAAMKGSALDPLSLDYSLSSDEIVKKAIELMEGVFELRPTECSMLDEETEHDENEDDNEEAALKRKSWGDSGWFCPVALKEQMILWPGNQDIAMKYLEKFYCFSTEETKQKFYTNSKNYVAHDKPLKLPPLRLFLLGAKGSGKTSIGKLLCKKLGTFHIQFKEYLQNQILHKMKKPPLISEDDFEDSENEGLDGSQVVDDDLDSDTKERLTEEESEIRAYLLHGDQLSEETIEKFTRQFWREEPFKSNGFVLEGFPSSSDELRYLCSKGFYPDCTVLLQIDEQATVKRLLPNKMQIWQRKKDKRMKRKQEAYEKKFNEWKEEKASRRAEVVAQYAAKLSEKRESLEEPDDAVDSDAEEYQEQLAEIDEEEFPVEEDEEPEEEYQDVYERMKAGMIEMFEEQTDSYSSIQDVLSELQIPIIVVDAVKKPLVVEYSVMKRLRKYTIDRLGILSKCTVLTSSEAKILVDSGYLQQSKFKKWCPVTLLKKNRQCVLPPNSGPKTKVFPITYRQRVYFTYSASTRDLFLANPEKYINQPSQGPNVPVRLAVVGPPKSGKSTVAKRFAKEFGCLVLSVGEAMRTVLSEFPDSELSTQIQSHLKLGQSVPDELSVLALDRALMNIQCNTRGFVLDGWPMTLAQVDLLTKYHIIPVCVVELTVGEKEVLRRGDVDRRSPDRIQPIHDSGPILLVKSSHYNKNIVLVRDWYTKQHGNWTGLNGERSKWKIWDNACSIALTSALQIQQYVSNIVVGKAASIAKLCITPMEFQAKLGEFSDYSPVQWILDEELIRNTENPLQYAVEYKGRYYVMSSKDEMDIFLQDPEKFVSSCALKPFPSGDLLPKQISFTDVKAMFPKQFEIQGYCPVTYVDGKKKYESLVQGNPDNVVEYKGKIYSFESNQKLQKFMRRPTTYEVSDLPTKLPLLKQPLQAVTSLPMLGYLEQSVATFIINALSAVGYFKPKYPFLDPSTSALVYMGIHLKAHNSKSTKYSQVKYKKKLATFEEQCNLIDYLSSHMKKGYCEPSQRADDFNHKMHSFLKLDGYVH